MPGRKGWQMMKQALLWVIAFGWLLSSQAEPTAAARPEVVAVYYPHWHSYDHGRAWKGEGWAEWEGLKAAAPRFPGHHPPLKPTWGYFDESDPAWTAKEIDLAADNGIDVFRYEDVMEVYSLIMRCG